MTHYWIDMWTFNQKLKKETTNDTWLSLIILANYLNNIKKKDQIK